MANEKFSDFTAEDDLANYTGLVGFDIGADNFKITPNEFAAHFPTYLNGTCSDMFGGTNTRNFVHFGGDKYKEYNWADFIRTYDPTWGYSHPYESHHHRMADILYRFINEKL